MKKTKNSTMKKILIILAFFILSCQKKDDKLIEKETIKVRYELESTSGSVVVQYGVAIKMDTIKTSTWSFEETLEYSSSQNGDEHYLQIHAFNEINTNNKPFKVSIYVDNVLFKSDSCGLLYLCEAQASGTYYK